MSRLRPGQVLHERYQVLSLIGQGSFARVYLANDNQWRGNLVALKEIPTGHFTAQEYAQFNVQFLQEAAFLMQLQHPGLPRVIEFFAAGQNYYLALEWVPGHNLRDEIGKSGPISEVDAIDYAIQLAQVLKYLHSRRPYPVLLGDLKPANVVVDYQRQLRVVDFGLARYATPGGQKRDYALVSPGFSPPEQYRNGQLDERCDLYALGATIYWCLHPVALEKFRFEVPSVRSFRPDLSSKINEVLTKCLQRERGHRYHNADQVIAALRSAQSELERSDKESSPADILSALYREGKKKFEF